MPPDLNSLPPSRSTSTSPFQQRNMGSSGASPEALMGHSPSRRSSSVSLAAAATINAADLSRQSSTSANNRASPQAGRVHERRRSAVPMNLNLNDPTMPGPGELSSNDRRSSIGNAFRTASPTSLGGSPIVSTGDPHHQRTPSLGELHQELEQEQEAQVNRLLSMIRQQQAQLQQLQQQQPQQAGGGTTAVIDDSTPTSERSVSFPTLPPLRTPSHRSSTHMPHGPSVRRSSNQTSPALGTQTEPSSDTTTGMIGIGGDGAGRRGSRDDSSFYQAETATLTRENQMLRQRIRELERQIGELTASSTHAPTTSSHLTSSSSADEGAASSTPDVRPSSHSATVEPEKT